MLRALEGSTPLVLDLGSFARSVMKTRGKLGHTSQKRLKMRLGPH